ncbi:vertebrate ancient opsin-like [Anopheles merus]|uniref:vertebrate ancient opsin-like n=1 Tax=Anopheles merus TaxID=30066 RepID=UPI001BE45F1C|nr:vertebrate ancient opsin-like [Anopheles merus]XP_041764801.1 vertebrate ancient opsin-like [Anopheles merus]
MPGRFTPCTDQRWQDVAPKMYDVTDAAAINSDHQELMAPWAYNGAAVTLFFIGFFGFFLNIFVIALMYKDVQLWTPMNIILFNLVCSDFSVSIIGNPLTLTSAISHRWLYGKSICVAYGFFMSLLGIASITTLTVLSYERFCLISRPFAAQNRSKQGACLAVLFIWSYSFALTSPPLFGWGAYVNEAANISCSVNWESQTANATSYIIFLFIFGLILPLAVIIYSYINIVLEMRKNSARVGRVNRAERRVTSMVAVMIVAFMVAWTPYAIFALIEQFGPPELIGPGLAVLPALVAKSSICYNPIIYVGMNTQFRAAFWRIRRSNGVAGQPDSNNTNNSNRDKESARHTAKEGLECSLDFCHWTVRGTRVSISSAERNVPAPASRDRSGGHSVTGSREESRDRHVTLKTMLSVGPRSPSSVAPVAADCSTTDVPTSGDGSVRIVRQDSELSVIHDGGGGGGGSSRVLVIKSQKSRSNML